MNSANLVAELKVLLEEKHLLKHPFYQAWEAGTLPKAALKEYTKQYYHLEKNFPRFLSATHANCEDAQVRQEILENLYDEEHGESNHRELWLRFAEAVGATREEVVAAAPLPETESSVNTFHRLAAESWLAGSAALAAYEAQMPEVANKKIEGLEKFYGITDDRGLRFFRVHGVMDIAHSNTWWNIIERSVTTPEEVKNVKAAFVQGRDALWQFLDGICRAYLPEMAC